VKYPNPHPAQSGQGAGQVLTSIIDHVLERVVAVPILQSLLLADHVYRDQMTGKHIICGVFSTIYFTPNPRPEGQSGGGGVSRGDGSNGGDASDSGNRADGNGAEAGRPPGGGTESRTQTIHSLMQVGSPYVYFSVTELIGRKTFEVRYVDLHENRMLFQTDVPIECDDPLLTIEVALPLPRLPLVALEERSYALEVICEGLLLGTHRVLARITPGSVPPTR
jgi:hypothetical protein